MSTPSNVTPLKPESGTRLVDRRRSGLRYDQSNVYHVLDFYPDLACICRDGKILWMNVAGEATIGGSIGIAVYPGNGETIDALLKSADTAMYNVKASGKNNVAFAS